MKSLSTSFSVRGVTWQRLALGSIHADRRVARLFANCSERISATTITNVRNAMTNL
jgi:hypothetical protein